MQTLRYPQWAGQISLHCLSGIDGHELKAGPATFALAGVISFWFTRIKTPKVISDPAPAF